MHERLQDFGAADLGDGFAFRIGLPMADLDVAPYGGRSSQTWSLATSKVTSPAASAWGDQRESCW